jgi:hypothetical protein
MSYFENDYLKRMLQALALFVARLARRGAGKDLGGAIEDLREAAPQLLGLDWDVLAAVDLASAKVLLRDADRARVYAELLDAEAQVHEAAGDEATAKRRRERAAAIRTLW